MDVEPRRPELSVEAPRTLARHASGSRGGLVIVLLLVVIGLQAAILWLPRGATGPAATTGVAGARVDAAEVLKAQAMRLEEMAVFAEAAQAWEDYLAHAALADAERAVLRYRAAKLWQEAGRHGEALAAYVRAEKEGLADEDARRAVGTRVVACLRALGHYGAIGSELRKLTAGGQTAADASPVVATFAGERLTVAEFERRVEKQIDDALERYAGQVDAETLSQERERMARAYRDPSRAEGLLRDLVMRELLVRRARELGLDREEAFRSELHETEALLLARALQSREVSAAVKATDTDLSAHYQAHREDYRVPEQAQLAVIEVASEEEGARRLAADGLGGDGEKFLAAARTVETPLVHGRAWPGYGQSEALDTAVFAAAAGTTLDHPIRVGDKVLLVHVIAREPSAIPPLEQVRDRVRRDYTARKRTELLDALMKQLMARYEVRLHPEALRRSGPGAGEATNESSPSKSDPKKKP